MLKYCTSTSTNSRLKLANFIFYVKMRAADHPKIEKLSKSLQVRLLNESIVKRRNEPANATKRNNLLHGELTYFPAFLT